MGVGGGANAYGCLHGGLSKCLQNHKKIQNLSMLRERLHKFTIFSHIFWKQTIDVQSRFTIYDFTSTLLLILIWKKNPLGILSVNWFEAGKSVSNKYSSSPFRSHIEKWQDNGQKNMGWVGFQKYYVILRVGHGKCLRLITRWVGGVKKGQKHAYVIFEWSLSRSTFCYSKSYKVERFDDLINKCKQLMA